MAGDKLDVFGESYYFQNNTGASNNFAIPVLNILTSMLGAPTGAAATSLHGTVTATQLNGLAGTTGGITSLFSSETTNNNTNTAIPKAYINWILFDEQFKAVASNFSSVGAINQVKKHYTDASLQNIPVTKNGYIYVYCSNESNVDVFFDNMQVVHTKGAILEENHYYPFGLKMAGICSQAAGKLENKNEFNSNELQNKEFTDGSGLETMDFNARMFDAQIGRFWQQDPMSEYMRRWSPYSFSFDNPIRYADPSGLEGEEEDGVPTVPQPVIPPKGVPAPAPPPVIVDDPPLPDVTVQTKTKPTQAPVTVSKPKENTSVWNIISDIVDIVPFVGSIKQIVTGIANGDQYRLEWELLGSG